MRQVLMIAGAASLLAGCGDDVSPEDRAAADRRDVAMVEAANNAGPPLRQVTPEPLLLPDIERYDMLGETCSYAPGTSLGARVISREADAFMKIDGEVERFSADTGSRELPMHTRSVYNSKDFSLVLALKTDTTQAESGDGAASEQGDLEGTVTLRDAYDRVVYEGSGLVQCSG